VVVDVRRFPGSRRHPHLAREELERTLPALGVGYRWEGETLGGRRRRTDSSRHPGWRNPAFQAYADWMDTNDFRDALVHLELEADQRRVAVMCSETLWWRCHRRLIADALVARGGRVLHLLDATHVQEHALPPTARVGADGWPVYDVGVDRVLDL
jgi:uncharacterized protein (DUF488 family)